MFEPCGLLAGLGQNETNFHDGGGVHLGDVDEQLLLRLSGEAGPRLRDGFHQVLAHRNGASGADSAADEGGVGVGFACGVVRAGGHVEDDNVHE